MQNLNLQKPAECTWYAKQLKNIPNVARITILEKEKKNKSLFFYISLATFIKMLFRINIYEI